MVGGTAVRPHVCPQPTAAATVRLVCTLYSPPPGQDSLLSGVAPVWATCTLPSLWYCFNGIWCISQGGSTRCTGEGGQAQFALPWVVPCGRGPSAPGWRQTVGGMDPQKHSIGCLGGASKFGEGNWFSLGCRVGDGRGKWRLPAPLFPCQALSLQASTTLPPSILLPSPLSESKAVDF